ncbi:MAG: DUF3990 domain-containing protein [Treponema sp.]|nr:DUF3990 domain-containing protein [Treponema sp.]
MIIYHGSDIPVIKPKILSTNRFLDFGEGFYTTSSYEQARRWSQRIADVRKSKNSIISFYDFDIDKAKKDLQTIQFDEPSAEWLNFVVLCRNGKETDFKYDIAIGPVANDNVYETIRLFETGIYTKDEAIIRLKIEKIYNQILFHTEEALKYCIYTKHENADKGSNE